MIFIMHKLQKLTAREICKALFFLSNPPAWRLIEVVFVSKKLNATKQGTIKR